MKNVLYINSFTQMGGAEYSLLEIFRYLPHKEFKPILVCWGQGALTERAASMNVKCINLPSPKGIEKITRNRPFLRIFWNLPFIIGFFTCILKLRKEIYKQRIDLVHTNNFKSLPLGLISTIFSDIPLVVHHRDIYPKFSLATLFFIVLALKKKLRIICISKAVLQSLPGIALKKSEVIYNGVTRKQPAMTRSRLLNELNLPENSRPVLYVGRIVPWKGVELLIKAFARVNTVLPDTCLLLVGSVMYWDPAYLGELKTKVRALGLEKKILFTGHRENTEDYYANADILVLPSKNEPFGRILVEAMLQKCPVLGLNEGGVPELIKHGENGFLIPSADPGDIAQSIISALSSRKLLARLGENGSAFALKHFTGERYVNQIQLCYGRMFCYEDHASAK
ncbi:MAG: glycosyltransferase family 4 protein [bacterium]